MAERWSPQQPLSKVLQKGALYRQYEGIRMSRRIVNIIAPVCEQMHLGIPIEPNMCRVTVKRVRIPDTDPYALSEDGALINQFREEIFAEIYLPSTAMMTKFKQILPSLHAYLATRGLGTIKLVPVLEPYHTAPQPFLKEEIYPRIGSQEAAAGAEALAEKLPKDSPLKREMELLAQSMKKNAR